MTEEQKVSFRYALLCSGLELMEDKKAGLIERIKNVIVEMVHYADEFPKLKNSEYIASHLQHDYT
jgi:vacuolar-type H+-ATPase subunit D/Vma8